MLATSHRAALWLLHCYRHCSSLFAHLFQPLPQPPRGQVFFLVLELLPVDVLVIAAEVAASTVSGAFEAATLLTPLMLQ